MNFFRKTLHYLNDRNHRLLPKKSNFTKVIFILIVCLTATFSIKTILAANENASSENTGRENSEPVSVTYYDSNIGNQLAELEAAKDGKKINAENWGEEMNNASLLGLTQVFLGQNISSAPALLIKKNNVANSLWTPGGLIGVTNNVIASLYTPPASGIEYIANSLNNIMGKPVYAANDGFNQLKGIQSLWKVCRNAVYALISIVFVVMGLLIMLRIKISPQATVTIQNSIPKIITTLILVTFSYAICGLIIDFSYLLQAFLLSLITQADTSQLFTGNLSIANLIKGGWDTHWSLMMNLFSLSSGSSTTFTTLTIGALGGIVGAILGSFVNVGVGTIIGGLLGFLVGLLLLVLFIFIQLVKFFFGCAKAYITLILKIISAPLEIALGAFPNSKMGFSSWFIQTIAYISVFPISIVFLVILNILTKAVSYNQIWTPGILQGSILSPYLGGLIGLAGLAILAKLPSLIPEAIFQLKPSPFGKAVGEGFQKFPGVGVVKGGWGVAKSGASLAISGALSSNPKLQGLRSVFSGNGRPRKPDSQGKPQAGSQTTYTNDQPPSLSGEPKG